MTGVRHPGPDQDRPPDAHGAAGAGRTPHWPGQCAPRVPATKSCRASFIAASIPVGRRTHAVQRGARGGRRGAGLCDRRAGRFRPAPAGTAAGLAAGRSRMRCSSTAPRAPPSNGRQRTGSRSADRLAAHGLARAAALGQRSENAKGANASRPACPAPGAAEAAADGGGHAGAARGAGGGRRYRADPYRRRLRAAHRGDAIATRRAGRPKATGRRASSILATRACRPIWRKWMRRRCPCSNAR